MKTVPVLIIDKDGNTCEIELNKYQYVNLGISKSQIKQHPKKSDLNKTINEFISRNKGDTNE